LDARKLTDEIRYPLLNGKICRALPFDKDLLRSGSNCNIFVKGFGKNWTHKELHEAFKGFGQILSARCSIDVNHESRGFGFVQFRNADEATKACQKMDGKKIDEITLEVTLFKSPAERGIVPGSTTLPKRQFNNLFVKNIPNNFTSEDLKVI
jgi:RNA recognition motif-containing protein